MKTKNFTPGDLVKIKTKSKDWEGHALESHNPEIILLKLKSGYNIGIRENEILDAKVLKKFAGLDKKKFETEINPGLPNVAVIITGGTISSRLDPKSGGVIPTDKEDILNIAPELKEICNPILTSPFMKFSEDMDPSDWKKIAETCMEYLEDEKISGIIITHGTDTLHYTSAALSFFIQKLNKPIALTYSQRSVDRASTDAALNLICAAKYAVSDIAEVALVGHENVEDKTCIAMPATKTRKMHSSKRDAFKVINAKPLARISPDNFEIIASEFNTRNSEKPKLDTKFEEKIGLIKIHPGQSPDILEFYKTEKYKGLIIEGTGLGHIPGRNSVNNWLPKIKKAIESGITICMAPQTIYGKLNPNVYSSGRDLQKTDIIFLDDMLSETALVKLGWVLAHKKWNKKEKMLENFAREISPSLEN